MPHIFKLLLILNFIGIYHHLSFGQSSENIPLKEKDWINLSYNKIPPNEVKFSDAGFLIKVKNSAGPTIHKLNQRRKIIGFSIKGKLTGSKVTEKSAFDEDSILRFGLVAVGDKKLTGAKKWFAADWVKKLFSLAPSNTGLDKIYFFNVTDRSELVGKSRIHPKSEFISENIFTSINKDGAFELTKKLGTSVETIALWISTDGDDTKSNFETLISEIQINWEP